MPKKIPPKLKKFTKTPAQMARMGKGGTKVKRTKKK